MADWLSSKWDFNFDGNCGSYLSADTCVPGDSSENANREFLDVLFPCKLEVDNIRIQGISSINIGSKDALNDSKKIANRDPLPNAT